MIAALPLVALAVGALAATGPRPRAAGALAAAAAIGLALASPGWGVEQLVGRSLQIDALALVATIGAGALALVAVAIRREWASIALLAALASAWLASAAHVASLALALALVSMVSAAVAAWRGADADRALDGAMAGGGLVLVGLSVTTAHLGRYTIEPLRTTGVGLVASAGVILGIGFLLVGAPLDRRDLDPWRLPGGLALGGMVRLGLVVVGVRLLGEPSDPVRGALLALAAASLVASFVTARGVVGRVGVARLADVAVLLALGGEVGREVAALWMVADVVGVIALIAASGPGRGAVRAVAVASLAGALPTVGLVARRALYEQAPDDATRALVVATALVVLWHGRGVLAEAADSPRPRWIGGVAALAAVALGVAPGAWTGWITLLVR